MSRDESAIDWAKYGAAPDARVFERRLMVGEAHVSNLIDHVANLEILRWLEDAAVAHSDSLGYTEAWYRENDLIWFVRRHEIDYLAEVMQGDDLVIGTWVEGFAKTSSPRRYVVYRRANDTVVAKAMTVWVLVSRSNHRPTRVPGEMIERFLRSGA